jgi:hypothetical protein
VVRSIVLVAVALLACGAPVTSTTPTAASGRPRVTSVVAAGDVITVTFDRRMLQIGEGSGVEMSGNYQLDSRALPQAAKIACRTRDCFDVGIALPSGTLAPGTVHTLRIANVVARNGPAIAPDPTTLSFTAR